MGGRLPVPPCSIIPTERRVQQCTSFWSTSVLLYFPLSVCPFLLFAHRPSPISNHRANYPRQGCDTRLPSQKRHSLLSLLQLYYISPVGDEKRKNHSGRPAASYNIFRGFVWNVFTNALKIFLMYINIKKSLKFRLWMVFTLESRITKLWGFPLLFCEQLTYLCLRSNWPRLSRPPIYRKVCCWLSWWKNSSHPPVTFFILSIFHPVQSHRFILIEVTITLFYSTTTKKLTLRAVSIQSAAGRNFSRISSLSSSLKQVYSKTKTKAIVGSDNMAIRLDREKKNTHSI